MVIEAAAVAVVSYQDHPSSGIAVAMIAQYHSGGDIIAGAAASQWRQHHSSSIAAS